MLQKSMPASVDSDAVRSTMRVKSEHGPHGLEYGGAQRVAAEKRQLLDHALDPHRFRAIVVIETEATALLRRASRRTASCRHRPDEQARLGDLIRNR